LFGTAGVAAVSNPKARNRRDLPNAFLLLPVMALDFDD
jgi:hypothetical protein